MCYIFHNDLYIQTSTLLIKGERHVKCKATFVLLVFMFVFSSILQPSEVAAAEKGLITASTTLNVRSAPSSQSEKIGSLKSGQQVEVQSSSKADWYLIDYNGKEGHIAKQYVKIISPRTLSSNIKIVVNGEELISPVVPPNIEGRLLVPFRVIAEAINIDVEWDAEKRQVIAKGNDIEVVFTIDRTETLVNGVVEDVTPQPFIIDGHTVIPLRFFSETFKAEVGWDNDTRIASVDRSLIELPLEELPLEEEVDPNVEIAQAQYFSTENMTGVVDTGNDTLNFRQQPTTNSAIIKRLEDGVTMRIIGFNKDWINVETNGQQGYVHSNFVKLFENNKPISLLLEPVVEQDGMKTEISWYKHSTTKVDGSMGEANTFSLQTNALYIEYPGLKTDIFKAFSVLEKGEGNLARIELNEEYFAIVLNKTEKLTVAVYKNEPGKKRIIIDAGHGDKDPGAMANSLREKDIVLDVSLYLADILRDSNYHVIFTRNDDTFLTLGERVELTNALEADAFISIHANAASNVDVKGTETFWNSGHQSVDSFNLATALNQELVKELATVNRGVKHANFYVIKNSFMPSALVEIAFLTNKDDAKLLSSEEFKKKSAEAIATGLNNYFTTK